MIDNVDLMEENEAVEDGEGWVVKDARKHDIFQVEQPVGIVNLLTDIDIPDRDDFLELGGIGKVLTVIGAMGREIGVICIRR